MFLYKKTYKLLKIADEINLLWPYLVSEETTNDSRVLILPLLGSKQLPQTDTSILNLLYP